MIKNKKRFARAMRIGAINITVYIIAYMIAYNAKGDFLTELDPNYKVFLYWMYATFAYVGFVFLGSIYSLIKYD